MGIFGDYAQRYFENGLSVMPVKDKRAFLSKWSQYNSRLPTQDEIDQWVKEFSSHNIGLLLGEASKVCAYDNDYNGPNSYEYEIGLRNILPKSPIEKVGQKGFTIIGRYSGATSCKIFKSTTSKAKANQVGDFFSNSGMIVLPPSIHPLSKKPYKWIGQSLYDFDVSELPFITDDHIERIKKFTLDFFALDKIEASEPSGRHTSIIKYGFAVIEDCISIEDFIERLIAYDQSAFGENNYFDDKNERGSKTPDQFAEYIAKSIISSVEKIKKSRGESFSFRGAQNTIISPVENKIIVIDSTVTKDDVEKDIKEKREFERYRDFFDRHFYFRNVEVDFLTGVPFVKSNGKYKELFNELGVIKSLASDWWLKPNAVEDHLRRWLTSVSPRLLLDIPDWDKNDRISEMLSFVKVKNISHDIFVDLQKDWLVGIFRRLKSEENQNTINLWEGGQGLGKDTFFMNMLRGFGRYKTEMNGDAKLTDIYSDIAKSLVIAMPEFDQFKNISAGAIKDMITSPGKHFRTPYARESKYHPFRCSFYSTANVNDYLKDPSGNRRFWIFEIEHIDFNYPKNKDVCLQLVSQIKHLFMDGFEAKKESISVMSKYVEENRTPEDPAVNILEVWDARVNDLIRTSLSGSLSYNDSIEIIRSLQSIYGLSHRRILTILKLNGRSIKDNGVARYFGRDARHNI